MSSKRFWIVVSIFAILNVAALVVFDAARREAVARAEASEAERDLEKLKDQLDYERELDESREFGARMMAFKLGAAGRHAPAPYDDESIPPEVINRAYRLGDKLRDLVCAAADKVPDALDRLLFRGRLMSRAPVELTLLHDLAQADAVGRVDLLDDFIDALSEDMAFLKHVNLRAALERRCSDT